MIRSIVTLLLIATACGDEGPAAPKYPQYAAIEAYEPNVCPPGADYEVWIGGGQRRLDEDGSARVTIDYGAYRASDDTFFFGRSATLTILPADAEVSTDGADCTSTVKFGVLWTRSPERVVARLHDTATESWTDIAELVLSK